MMDDRQRDKYFRRSVFQKIAEIEDKHCEPCEVDKSHNKIASVCAGCEYGKELQRYGKLLSDRSNQRKAPRTTEKKKEEEKTVNGTRKVDYELEVNGLTRDKYKMLKDEGKSDAELLKIYKITNTKLTATKEKWGLLGYRGNVKSGIPKKKMKNPHNPVPVNKQDQTEVIPTPRNDSLQKDYETLKSEHEKLLDHNVGAAEEFLKLNNELEKSKETIFDLQIQISHKDHHIDALQDQVNELERLESIEEKYLAIVAALKLHLPEVGETT